MQSCQSSEAVLTKSHLRGVEFQAAPARYAKNVIIPPRRLECWHQALEILPIWQFQFKCKLPPLQLQLNHEKDRVQENLDMNLVWALRLVRLVLGMADPGTREPRHEGRLGFGFGL